MSIVGLIPARGGSKGIPRKNLADLGGRPLIAWTIEAALASRALSRVVVSTDDAEIADTARGCGAEVPFLRPAELAADQSGALEVIRHAITELEKSGAVEAIAYLQPTSPLRGAADIDRAVALFRDRGADSVVSVVRVPHSMSAAAQFPMAPDGRVSFAMPGGGAPVLRRQDKPVAFARNGPAVLVVSRRCAMQSGVLYGERTFALEMDKIASFDVDEPVDLELARAWIRRRDAG